MKTVARIYKWVVISVLLQMLILTYINFFYLNRDGKVTTTAIDLPDDKPKTNISLKIPSDAGTVKVSYDGSYVSYTSGNKIDISDAATGNIKKAISHNGDDISFYRWLPDKDIIIYAVKSSSKQSGTIQLITYNMDSEMETTYKQVGNLPKNSEITDIELSSMTSVIYAKIKSGSSDYKIYRFDINDLFKCVVSTEEDITIKETNYKDNLVYLAEKGKMFVRDGVTNSTKSLPFKDKMVLLEVDSEDNIYAGELDKDDKVINIYYGKVTEDISKEWKKASLDKPVQQKDIFISPNGKIYNVSDQDNKVIDVGNKNKISYQGKILEIWDGFIAAIDNGTLKINPIK